MPATAPSPLVERLGLPPDARVVIINADDLGMLAAANEGCFDALGRGCATSASLMVPCPFAADAAAIAAAWDGADVGVHLTLNCEWESLRWGPLTEAPSLRVEDGGFPTGPTRVREDSDTDEVRGELRAQVDRALTWGVDVTHLDAHMYTVQDDPRLFEVYLETAVRYSLPLRLTGSVSDEGMQARRRAAAAGVVAPDHLVALPRMGSRQPLTDALRSLPPGVTELHAHPAVDSPELRAVAADWPTRVDDHHLLCEDDGFRALLRDSGAVVLGYRELREVMRAG